jgi:hypothetical protein
MPPYGELTAIHSRFRGIMGRRSREDSELVAAYRLNAANCTEMARHFGDVEHKIALLDMAQAWLRLAEITEKFGEALQNVPAPLIMPSGSGQS